MEEALENKINFARFCSKTSFTVGTRKRTDPDVTGYKPSAEARMILLQLSNEIERPQAIANQCVFVYHETKIQALFVLVQ